MTTKIIEHPIRKITIQYDESIPWSEVDHRLEANFIRLHDRISEFLLDTRALLADFGALDKHIEEVREGLKPVIAAIEEARAAADAVLPGFRLKITEPAQKFTGAVNKATEVIQAYDDAFRVLEADLKRIEPSLTVFIEKMEPEEDPLWEEESDDKYKICAEEGHSIDCVSFDNEDDYFRGLYSSHKQHWDSNIDYCNKTIDNYNTLLLEISLQYKLWDEFGLRCKLIADITQQYEADEVAKRN